MSDATERLEAAKKQVKLRMTGCSQPDCSACRNNDRAIEELIDAARATVGKKQ